MFLLLIVSLTTGDTTAIKFDTMEQCKMVEAHHSAIMVDHRSITSEYKCLDLSKSIRENTKQLSEEVY